MITNIYNRDGVSVPTGKRNEIPRLEQTGESSDSDNGNEWFGKCFRNSSVSVWWERSPDSQYQPAAPGIRVGNVNTVLIKLQF